MSQNSASDMARKENERWHVIQPARHLADPLVAELIDKLSAMKVGSNAGDDWAAGVDTGYNMALTDVLTLLRAKASSS